ncbi:MAG: hypothetical protein KDA83_20555 [Planctomycetales bacterium]|nr:hypothetical protein [Planctomycetales bacterium]
MVHDPIPKTSDTYARLVLRARAAVAQAFTTAPGGTRYGAAVLTAGGRVYDSGQYSSFNHCTNIHAEQGAILLATMTGEPDIIALAVASTGSEPVTRPCGVCRQTFAEHAARTGRDFEVLMAFRDQTGFETRKVSQLLPNSWSPGQEISGMAVEHRSFVTRVAGAIPSDMLSTGDQVTLPDQSVGMVWDAKHRPNEALIKVKYSPCDQRHVKLPHSFTQPLVYQSALTRLRFPTFDFHGSRVALQQTAPHVQGFGTVALPEDIHESAAKLWDEFDRSGIEIANVRITGSRALGINQATSDWDLIVPASTEQIARLRLNLGASVERGDLSIPDHSGTWKRLERVFPGGRSAAVAQRRYADTLVTNGQTLALIFVPTSVEPPSIPAETTPIGRQAFFGRVVEASASAFKRARFTVDCGGELVSVTSYHKTANLLREGDVVSVSGCVMNAAPETKVVQYYSQPDSIIWWSTA